MDLLVFYFYQTAFKIHQQIAYLVFGASNMLVALGMAQSGTDTCQKLSCTKWLGEIVICAQIQSSDLALFKGSGRDNDNRSDAPGTDLFNEL